MQYHRYASDDGDTATQGGVRGRPLTAITKNGLQDDRPLGKDSTGVLYIDRNEGGCSQGEWIPSPSPPPSSNNTNPTSTHSLIRSYTCLSIKVLEATRGIVAGDQYDDLTQLPSFKPAPSIPFNEAWGSNHQDNGKPELKRAVFSDKETYLIGKIYREMKNDDSNPDNFGGPIDTENTSQYYRILKTIRNDKELWPDFHPRHVIDATRIRPGLLKVSYSPLTLPFYYIFHFSYFPPRL